MQPINLSKEELSIFKDALQILCEQVDGAGEDEEESAYVTTVFDLFDRISALVKEESS